MKPYYRPSDAEFVGRLRAVLARDDEAFERAAMAHDAIVKRIREHAPKIVNAVWWERIVAAIWDGCYDLATEEED